MIDSASDVIRTIFFWLDQAIYTLIKQAYSLFLLLSQTTIFNSDVISDFSSRIYVLVSLIMAFRLAFSFINYIVSPDQISDKQKGGGKLITNVVVSIALLASVPTIFNEAYYLQKIIVQNGVIEKLVLGSYSSNTANSGDLLPTYTFLAFFSPNTRVIGCENQFGIEISEGCVSALNTVKKEAGNDYVKVTKNLDLSYIWNSSLLTASTTQTNSANNFSEEKTYAFNYQFGISTVIGGIEAFILLGFCLDLAIRVVKLGFLQLIAPIPILMYIAPGKKSTGMLSNWGRECLSTWTSLFIRNAVITFSIYLISMVNSSGGIMSFVSGGTLKNNNLFVSIFVMLGILLFAKEFPKLLEDILGMKNPGKLTLNPLKKLKTDMVGAGLIGGATAGLLGGGIGGAVRGAIGGLGAKNFTEGAKKAADKNNNLRQSKLDGSTAMGRTVARYNKFSGATVGESGKILDEKKHIDDRIKDYDNKIKTFEEKKKEQEDSIKMPRRRIEDLKSSSDSIKSMEDRAVGQVEKGIGQAGEKYLQLKAEADRLRTSGADADSIAKAEGIAMDYKDNAGKYEYMNQSIADANFDKTFTNMRETAIQRNKFAGIEISGLKGEELHSTFGKTKGAIGQEERSIADTERGIREIDDMIKEQQFAKSKFDQRKRDLAEREAKLKANQDAIK